MKAKTLFILILLSSISLYASDYLDLKEDIRNDLNSNRQMFDDYPLYGLYDLEVVLTQTPQYGSSAKTTMSTKMYICPANAEDCDYKSICIDPISGNKYDDDNFFYALMFHITRIGDSNKYNFNMFSELLKMGTKRVKINNPYDFSFDLDLSKDFIAFVWGSYIGTDINIILNVTKEYPTKNMLNR